MKRFLSTLFWLACFILMALGVALLSISKLQSQPNPLQPGHYRGEFSDSSGKSVGTIELYFPNAPKPMEVGSHHGARGAKESNEGWISIRTANGDEYFPISCSAYIEKKWLGIWRNHYFEVDFAEGFRWVGSVDSDTFEGSLTGGGTFFFRRIGSYDERAIETAAVESIQRRLQAMKAAEEERLAANQPKISLWERIKGAFGEATDSTGAFLSDAAKASGEFLSDPAFQDFMVQGLRFLLDAKFGNGQGNSDPDYRGGSREPVNANQHMVYPTDGSAPYRRTNPDGNPYNNFSSPR